MQLKNKFIFAGIMALLLISGCIFPGRDASLQEDIQVQLNEEFNLQYHQTAIVENENIFITFKEVVSDSRCPVEVLCAIAGDAVITLHVNAFGDEQDVNVSVYLVDFVDIPLPTGEDPLVQGEIGNSPGYTILIEDLMPYPSQGKQIQNNEYIVTLIVVETF
jgi:hypothetical protein